ncbi:MAG: hypothetical protein DME45_01960 [Verrucomicrobia bacterium]|nr:MAG: hypothetical protein DME45_01960 [Verrucomicrobiota bacterium]
MKATLIDAPNRSGIFLRSDFVLLTRGKSLDVPEIQKVGYALRLDRQVSESRIWTDDYSNVIRLLINPLKKSRLR